jgi:hypothetical protein
MKGALPLPRMPSVQVARPATFVGAEVTADRDDADALHGMHHVLDRAGMDHQK